MSASDKAFQRDLTKMKASTPTGGTSPHNDLQPLARFPHGATASRPLRGYRHD